MILLHIKDGDEHSLRLKRELEGLVISFKTVLHQSNSIDLPYIEESGETYHKEEEIKEWLEELKSELNVQRTVSGDGCYINPKNGKSC